MKRILNYGRHWLRSRGRHGTHSPFVYAFVEQVLRNKNKIKTERVRQLPLPSAAWSLREMKLLYKTLHFLQPQYVLLPDDGSLARIGALVPQIIPNATVLNIGTFDYAGGNRNCLLVATVADLDQRRFGQAIQAGISVLVLHPHDPHAPQGTWEALYSHHEVKMSLDYWYFGLLMNDAAFKQKQHFRLR